MSPWQLLLIKVNEHMLHSELSDIVVLPAFANRDVT
jgi:hypothetical protein